MIECWLLKRAHMKHSKNGFLYHRVMTRTRRPSRRHLKLLTWFYLLLVTLWLLAKSLKWRVQISVLRQRKRAWATWRGLKLAEVKSRISARLSIRTRLNQSRCKYVLKLYSKDFEDDIKWHQPQNWIIQGKRDSSQETVPFSLFRDKLCMKGLLIMTILDFK